MVISTQLQFDNTSNIGQILVALISRPVPTDRISGRALVPEETLRLQSSDFYSGQHHL
jgi:hypothetical protein